MEVLTTHGKQRQLTHELLVLGIPVLLIQEVEPLNVRCKLNNATQFTLICGGFLVAHVNADTVLTQLLVHDTTVLIAAVVTFLPNHMRLVLLQLSDPDGASHCLITTIEHYVVNVDVRSVTDAHWHTQ